MPTLSNELSAFLRRYRIVLTAKTSLIALLVLVILIAVRLRFNTAEITQIWSHAVLLALGLGAVVALGLWFRRKWLSRTAAVRTVDDRLKLDQRLMTAAQFEKAAEPPLLYQYLVQDTMSRFSQPRKGMPRLLDRGTMALVLLALILLLWPIGGRAPIELAGFPNSINKPEPDPEETPPSEEEEKQDQAQEQDRERNQQGQNQQQQVASASGSEGQSEKDQKDPSSKDNSSGREGKEQDSSKDQSERGEAEGAQQDREQDGTSGQDLKEPREQAEGREERQMAEGEPKDSQRTERESQVQRGEQQEQSASKRRGELAQDKESSSSEEGTKKQKGQSAEAPGKNKNQREGESKRASSSGADIGSMQEQQALRADIQELLKELQGELQDLQSQLAKTSDDAIPKAGTSTDPDLYDPTGAISSEKGKDVPIQLKTDEAPSSLERPGGGIGKATDEIAKTGPAMDAEDAALASQQLEEDFTDRLVIPPAYQPIFQRLNRRSEKE